MAACTIIQTDWANDAQRLAAIRRTVFIDEQGVPEELEWDEFDEASVHFLAITDDGAAIGCARLLPDGHLGRMAVLPAWRRRGVGSALLQAALARARQKGLRQVGLHAQVQAIPFYARFGFQAHGPEFDEAGIPHRGMNLDLTEN